MGSKYFSFIIAGAIVFIVISIFAASCKSGGAIMSPAADEPGGESANPYVAAVETMPPEVFTGKLSPVGAAMEHPKTLVAADKSPLGLTIAVIESEGSLRAENIKLTQTRTAHGYIAEISAVNAKDATQALFEVRFDTARFHVSGWRIGEFLAADTRAEFTDGHGDYSESAGGVGKLEKVEGGASVVKAAGALCALIAAADHAGVAVARIDPDVRGAASGSGAVCTLEFSHGPAVFHSDSGGTELTGSQSANSRSGGASSAAANRGASAETGGGFWDWKYGTIMPMGTDDFRCASVIINRRMPGDADRNYEVSIADITPIALQYEKSVVWLSSQYGEDYLGGSKLIQYATDADLNHDGEVGISDITEIANNYNRKYFPKHIAERPKSGGSWNPVKPLTNTKPYYHGPQDSYDTAFTQWIDFQLMPNEYDYGIPYINQSDNSVGALPLVYQEFGGTMWANFFYRAIAAERVTGESSEWYLNVEFSVLGDYDKSGEVNIPDITVVVLNYQRFRDSPWLYGQPNLYPFFDRLADSSCPDDELLAPFSAIYINYLFMYPGILEVKYYETAEAVEPFWISGDSSAPPAFGAMFVEITGVMTYAGLKVPMPIPGRHEVYFPPPEVE